jgi:N-acetyl-gamma-glutamyl-phosphate reductase
VLLTSAVSPCINPGRDTVVVLSVIDNLVKGAAGQAIQNMNIMSAWMRLGLDQAGILP